MNLLRNGDFEADWSEQRSHRCLVLQSDGQRFETEIGNIFTPPGWLVWYRHEPGVWDQPECRDARATDPDRMRSGEKGFVLFGGSDASHFSRHRIQSGIENPLVKISIQGFFPVPFQPPVPGMCQRKADRLTLEFF